MKVTLCLLLVTILLCSGCKSVEHNTLHSTDTMYVVKHTRDSIYIRDSVSRVEKTILDTVYVTESRWKIKYRDRVLRDTVYQSRIDSVSIVTKVYPTPTEKAKTAIFWMVVGVGLAIAFIIAKKILI